MVAIVEVSESVTAPGGHGHLFWSPPLQFGQWVTALDHIIVEAPVDGTVRGTQISKTFIVLNTKQKPIH